MKHTLEKYLKDMAEQQDADTAAGIRYLYVRAPEPLSCSIRRRLSLLWQLVRLRPDRYWREDWEDFRRSNDTMQKITSEHPQYATAHIPNKPFYGMALDQSPWTCFLKDKFPEGMGETITRIE